MYPELDEDVSIPTTTKNEKPAGCTSLHQPLSPPYGQLSKTAVIRLKATNCQERGAVKCVKKPEDSINQVLISTGDQIIDIANMYIKNGDLLFTSEQMEISLRHMTSILQDRPLNSIAQCSHSSSNPVALQRCPSQPATHRPRAGAIYTSTRRSGRSKGVLPRDALEMNSGP